MITALEPSDLIYKSDNSMIYYQKDSEFEVPVVVKILAKQPPTIQQLAYLTNEYEAIKNTHIKGIRRVFEQTEIDGKVALVLEYVEGDTLRSILKEGPLSISRFLKIAISISQTLGEIHQQHIIHRDINNNNILVHPETSETTIIDFGIASKIDTKSANLSNPDVLEGTLAYISPEQTGRMNRAVDYRTDLYSLGVAFYRALTGEFPFANKNSMELVHAHIAKKPVPPQEVQDHIPPVLSAIVMRLLEKNAEDRYQSAFGLKHDLEQCATAWTSNQTISAFELGQQDFSNRFHIVEKLYGREQEIQALLNVFEQVAQGGKEIMLVGGYSGVGKSALVHEIHKPITKNSGHFISGKYDQFNRDVPYSAINEAFYEFCDYLMTLKEEELQVWKNIILHAVGNNGKVLTDVIPNLELVIGPQPEVPKAGLQESLNRFNAVVQNFVKAISTKEHPLVLFLDDLQWVDLASLDLLQLLMKDEENQYFLLICAYRDNEVDENHSFIHAIKDLEKYGLTVHNILLKKLDKAHVNEMISEALMSDSQKVESFTELVYEKTLGNAFFTHQLLNSIDEDGLLQFDFEQKKWHWDIEKIKAKNISDNVVDLMSSKIIKLPSATQEILKLTSCIGNTFEINMLGVISEKTPDQLMTDLWEAIAAGLIYPLDENYKLYLGKAEKKLSHNPKAHFKYIHDRIQQAAYSLIDVQTQKEIHLKTGRLLHQYALKEGAEVVNEQLFDIVNQLNAGIALITDSGERLTLAELNLQAGKKAKESAAYSGARNYLQIGIQCLPNNAWNTHYGLTLQLYVQSVEVGFLLHDVEYLDACYEEVINNARSILDKMEAYETKMHAFTSSNQMAEAVKLSLDVLSELKVKIAKKPRLLHVLAAVLKVKWVQGNKKIDTFTELPVMQDPYKQAAVRLMMVTIPPAYIAAPNVLARMVCEGVYLSIKYGNTPASSYIYGIYGFFSCGALGQFDTGYEYAQLGLRLVKKFDAKVLNAMTIPALHYFTSHWKQHPSKSTPHLLKAIEVSYEMGNFEYISWNGSFYTNLIFLTGNHLVFAEEEYRKYVNLLTKVKQPQGSYFLRPILQAIKILQHGPNEQNTLVGEVFDETSEIEPMLTGSNFTGVFHAYLAKIIITYTFETYEESLKACEKAAEYLDAVLSMPIIPPHNLYYSLTMLKLWDKVPVSQQKKFRKQIAKNQKSMKTWAKHAPMNYSHKYYLVEAERYRVAKREKKARECYKTAIELAKKHNYTQEIAIACECYALFWLKNQEPLVAAEYMQEAVYYYNAWGAAAKVRQIQQKYPQLVSAAPGNHPKDHSMVTTMEHTHLGHTVTASSGSTSGGSFLDLSSILKASQALSQEVKIEGLAEKMLQIVIENTGAEKGFIIDNDPNDGLVLRVQGDVSATWVNAQPPKLSDCDDLPLSIINYVVRSQQEIVLDDAQTDEKYAQDAYIQASKPKSILCFPVFRKKDLSIIFYLENNLTSGAFTPARLEVLNTLSSQIAISIENALLYENLEHKVQERTLKLDEALKEIRTANRQVMDSIYYAKRIQEAILVSNKQLQSAFNEHFILYLPKDVVSGDFYWMSKLQQYTFVAVVDCTGHGVPGAFMSMIGNTLLNELVNEQKNQEPHKILELLHTSIRSELKQTETENKDGMDVCLCRLEPKGDTIELVFSGAKRPLFYTDEANEIQELKGDRQTIGGWQAMAHQDFTQQSITLPRGSILYLTSDGYVDTPNPNRKSFTKKRLLKLLTNIQEKPMPEQGQILQQQLEKFQQGAKQRDDITIVGLKV